MAKRKILIIIDSLGEGGAQRIVADVIAACGDIVDIDLVALYWFDFEKHYYDMLKPHCASIQTICHPTKNIFEKAIFRSWAQLTRWRNIKTIIETGGYDLIHTHMIMSNQLIYPLARHFPDIPVLGTYHSNFDHKSSRFNRKSAKALEAHDHVFCDIEAGYRDMQGVFADDSKLEHLEFSIDQSYFSVHTNASSAERANIRKKYGIPVSSRVLCSIARIDFHDRKIDQFIKAFSIVCREIDDVVLAIVGTGKDLPAAQKLAETHGISDKVYFLGHSSDLHALYAMSDIYLTLTCRDDVGVAGKQAIAAGVPTFALTMKPSTLGSGRYFADAVDATTLAQGIIEFCRSTDGESIAKRRAEALRDFCDRNNMIERHRVFYRSFTKGTTRFSGSQTPE